MANILLPTINLNLQNENASFSNQRTEKTANVYSTVNTHLPFMNRPEKQMRFLQEASEIADNFAQRVIDRKKEALFNQTQNEMLTALSERENQYKALKGQDAIDGYEQYVKDINKIKSDYDSVFQSHKEESHKFSLYSSDIATKYGIEGKNFYDSKVIEKADNELSSLYSNSMSEWFKHFNSPQEAEFKKKAFDVLDQIADRSGIVKGTEEYNKQVSNMIDAYAKTTVMYQIHTKNYGGAYTTLMKCKKDMGGELYTDLLGRIKGAMLIESERNKSASSQLNKKFEELKGADAYGFKEMRKDFYRKQYPNKYTDEQLNQIVQRELVHENNQRRLYNNTEALLGHIVMSEFTYLIDNNKVDNPTDPFSSLSNQTKQLLLEQNDFDEEKARNKAKGYYDSVYSMYGNTVTGAGKELLSRLQHDADSVLFEIGDMSSLNEWFVKNPQTPDMHNKIYQAYTEAQIKMQNGEGNKSLPYYTKTLNQALTMCDLEINPNKDNGDIASSFQRSEVVSVVDKETAKMEKERRLNPNKYKDIADVEREVTTRVTMAINSSDFKEKGKKIIEKADELTDTVANYLDDLGYIVNDEQKLKDNLKQKALHSYSVNGEFVTAEQLFEQIKPELESSFNNPNEEEVVLTPKQQQYKDLTNKIANIDAEIKEYEKRRNYKNDRHYQRLVESRDALNDLRNGKISEDEYYSRSMKIDEKAGLYTRKAKPIKKKQSNKSKETLSKTREDLKGAVNKLLNK